MRAYTDSDPGNRRLPGEDDFNEETKEFLAVLRSIPPVPEEDDPNDWFHQIYDHLKRSPQQRMERWAWFADGVLRYQSELRGRPYVKFDPVRVLRTLTAGGVVFVVVGMGAGYLQGAPYPSYNIDITPSLDHPNAARLADVLALLDARPLEWDGWEPVTDNTMVGFRQLMTLAGMVNVVDVPWGVGGYGDVMAGADKLEVAAGLTVSVASLETVIRSKKAMVNLAERIPRRRAMDGLHVLMGEETLALAKKYSAKWNLSTAS